jgi:integrase
MKVRQQECRGQVKHVVDWNDATGRHQRQFPDDAHAQAFAASVATEEQVRANQSSLVNLFARYLAATSARRRPISQATISQRLRRLTGTCKALGLWTLSQVGPDTFGAVTRALQADSLSECSVWEYLNAWRSVMHWAVVHGLVNAVKLGEMSPPRITRRPTRYLNTEEIERLLSSLNGQPVAICVYLGLFEGMRRREVCDLKVCDLDLSRNEITVQRGKSGKPRTIQLHPKARAALEEHPFGGDALCQCRPGQAWSPGSLGRSARIVFDTAGLPDVSFHTLRHTCASQMAISGRYTLHQIARFLGHSTITTTELYSHLSPNQVTPDW